MRSLAILLLFLNWMPSGYPDTLVTVSPKGEAFQAGKVKMTLLGRNYRKIWVIPVTVPVFNVDQQGGGLTIIKKGGGDQTRSLRLENKEGKQWVLRSVDKDLSRILPENFRIGMAQDVVQDQMSATLPWGALAVPRLADAAGVYHTNPQIVFLELKSLPEGYREGIGEGLYLFEERPAGNRSELAGFGFSEKIIGTDDMLANTRKKGDHRVDQEQYLRSRLLDILISDWDRHEDQWRWGVFHQDGETIYKAIPRDRDMAFYVSEGLLIHLSSKTPFLRKMQGLDNEVKDLKGLNYQARNLDRRCLTGLSREQWTGVALDVQQRITDSILDAALEAMPVQVGDIHGTRIKENLSSRRNNLVELAESYYEIVNHKVDVVGTNQPDFFLVDRINDDQTSVTVISRNSSGSTPKPLFQRTFDHKVTSEIRLYGGKEDDEFRITGNASKGLTIRIIGEKGMDLVFDSSRMKGLTKKTILYDNKNGYQPGSGKEVRKVISRKPGKYAYTYRSFDYNQFFPLLLAGYNIDDGIFLGAGAWWRTFGFMKEPYASQHRFGMTYAWATNALEFTYDGVFTRVWKDLDFHLFADIRDPRYTQNFFGMGNQTIQNSDNKNYYRVRIGQIFINPEFVLKAGANGSFASGLFYQNVKVDDTPDRFIDDFSVNGLDSNIFQRKQFLGINLTYTLDNRNSEVFPTSGFHWTNELRSFTNLRYPDRSFIRIASEASWFLGFGNPSRIVLAFRAGAEGIIGTYDFFQAATLGGKENLRGYRDSRFSGDFSLYQNSELRIRLLSVKSYVSKGHFGILLFNDVGRVWYGKETSHRWHDGYGGGLWVSPFGMAIFNLLYERSADEKGGLVSVRFGFLF